MNRVMTVTVYELGGSGDPQRALYEITQSTGEQSQERLETGTRSSYAIAIKRAGEALVGRALELGLEEFRRTAPERSTAPAGPWSSPGATAAAVAGMEPGETVGVVLGVDERVEWLRRIGFDLPPGAQITGMRVDFTQAITVPQHAQHQFRGRLWCEICNLPPGDPIHAPATAPEGP